MVNVLVHQLVAIAGAPLPQLPQLVLRILTFVVGTDASVDSYAHLIALRIRGIIGPFIHAYLSLELPRKSITFQRGFLITLFPVVLGTTTVGSERCAGLQASRQSSSRLEKERQKTYAGFLFGF